MSRQIVKKKIDRENRQREYGPWNMVLADIDTEIYKIETKLSDLKKSKAIVKGFLDSNAPFPGSPHE
jgi:hypothetical protein